MSSKEPPIIAIGIDVGGTHTRLGVVNNDRRIVNSRRTKTIRDADGGALLHWLVQAVDEVLSDVHTGHHDVVPVGLALPGVLDRSRRTVVRSVSLPFLENRPIVDELAERTARSVRLATDSEAATWGEYISRSPLPRNFVHLRLGTGIGCGAVVDGELQRLDLGRTGHLDELVIGDALARFRKLRGGTPLSSPLNKGGKRGVDRYTKTDFPLDSENPSLRAAECPCGKHGCLETVASGPVLYERAVEAGLAVESVPAPGVELSRRLGSGHLGQSRLVKGGFRGVARSSTPETALSTLQRGWEQGDPRVRAIVDATAHAVAIALTNLARRFNPDVICIGGGVASACPCLVAETDKRFRKLHGPRQSEPSRLASGLGSGKSSAAETLPSGSRIASPTEPTPPITIESAILGDDAGILGAALLASDV